MSLVKSLSGRRGVLAALLIVIVALAACTTATPAVSIGAPMTPTTFTDPFAYCAAVGTVDIPDARYTGLKIPDSVALGLNAALNLPEGTPAPPITQNSFWRCMDGKVYACTVGANLPCMDKANTDRTPTDEINQYCQENSNSDFIPMAVTGHNTLYEWSCRDGKPEVGKQLSEVDARGFLMNIWYEIQPGAK